MCSGWCTGRSGWRRDAADRTFPAPPPDLPVHHPEHNGALAPLARLRLAHVAAPLDTATMQEAATELIGEHDFAAFSRREGVPTVRCLRRCDVAPRGALLTVEVEANAFLRQQVRRTVGALMQVGSGRLSVAGFRDLLHRAEPNSAEPLAPAHGLCLLRVAYPDLDLGAADTLS